MIRAACISILLLASAREAEGQVIQYPKSECAGFELGPPPPPPPPGATESDYPDLRDAHKWCRVNWCSLINILVSNSPALREERKGWSNFTLLRTEAFFGDAFQVAIWEFPDGRIEVRIWELPPWNATTGLLYRFRHEHPDSLPPDVAKAIPVKITSSSLTQSSKQALKVIQRHLQSSVRQGMPAMDDRSYWVATESPGQPPREIRFFAAPNHRLSGRIYKFIRSIIPNMPNPPLNSDPIAAR